MKMAIGVRDKPSDAEIDRVVAGAVDMFLCKYEVKVEG